MSNYVNPLTLIALSPLPPKKESSGGSSFFEAMARAWGEALDKQADLITQKSDAITAGDDKPQAITELTAQSLKMSFLANSSHSAISAVGQGLETMARKQ
jgi:hypothetical protein